MQELLPQLNETHPLLNEAEFKEHVQALGYYTGQDHAQAGRLFRLLLRGVAKFNGITSLDGETPYGERHAESLAYREANQEGVIEDMISIRALAATIQHFWQIDQFGEKSEGICLELVSSFPNIDSNTG
jgi:hypothetical protein